MAQFTRMNHLGPLIGTAAYLAYPKQLRINPTVLHYLSIAHNTALAVFSGWTFVSLLAFLMEKGLVIQPGYYFQDSRFDTIIWYFYLSKYYEYMDTFLVYLKGREPIFLQTFHHVGAVFIWHLFYVCPGDVIWMATLANSFIHTIMYSYYLGTLLKINAVKILKQYVTSMQLLQFLITMPTAIYLYYPKEDSAGRTIIIIFAIYVLSLIGLFGKFYYETYIQKSRMLDSKA